MIKVKSSCDKCSQVTKSCGKGQGVLLMRATCVVELPYQCSKVLDDKAKLFVLESQAIDSDII